MTDKTKAVNLTQNEIIQLVKYHGRNVSDNFSNRVERLGYLHKRLKTFNEPDTEIKPDPQFTVDAIKPDGWGSTAK
jgi:hypothetical protein